MARVGGGRRARRDDTRYELAMTRCATAASMPTYSIVFSREAFAMWMLRQRTGAHFFDWRYAMLLTSHGHGGVSISARAVFAGRLLFLCLHRSNFMVYWISTAI